MLAVECIKAFEAVGMDRSEHHQVKKALALCSSYPAPCKKPTNKRVASSTVADLWRQDMSGELEADTLPIDKKQLAVSILGETLWSRKIISHLM